MPHPPALEDLASSDLRRLWKSGDQRAAELITGRYAIRLVALVASHLNRKYRGVADPQDIVQSALGSFFVAAQQSRIHVSQSISLWNLLATFAQRKMLRSIERQSTVKRGGEFDQVPINDLMDYWAAAPTNHAATLDELLADLDEELPLVLREILDRLLSGMTQIEIATDLGVTERTVRRRIVNLRDHFTPQRDAPREDESDVRPSLPRIGYHEFVLGKLIGAGGFGKVYRASMQTGKNEVVAVKFLRKAFWKNPAAKASFLSELDQASRIDHPSVVRYLGWGESPHGGPFAVARWIDGSPLIGHRSATSETFLEYLHQICNALKAVHAAGVVHGDLTPSNILVDHAGRTWITDFGFAQSIAARTIPLGGTLGFAAPEQISPTLGRVSAATDIYAIGGLAYWYLTGQPPHAANSNAGALASTIAAQDISTSELPTRSRATEAIKQLAVNCLKKSIHQRSLSF